MASTEVGKLRGRDFVDVGSSVWDAELRTHTEVTDATIVQYASLVNQIQMSTILRDDAFMKMRSTRAFVALDYHSFGEWAEDAMGVSDRTARRYAERGEKMFMLGNIAETLGIASGDLRDEIAKLPGKSQQLMLRIPLDDLDVRAGIWVDPNGEKRTAEEVVQVMLRDQQEKMRRDREKISSLEQREKLHQAEIEQLKKTQTTSGALEELAREHAELRETHEKLFGERQRGQAAAERIAAAERAIHEQLQLVKAYTPRSERDFNEWPEELVEAIAVIVRLKEECERQHQRYITLRHNWEQKS